MKKIFLIAVLFSGCCSYLDVSEYHLVQGERDYLRMKQVQSQKQIDSLKCVIEEIKKSEK